MHRLTARLLLVLLFLGIFAPVGLAMSATPPHACCMRKPLQGPGSRHPEFQTAAGEPRNCCPPVTTTRWIEVGLGIDISTGALSASLPADRAPVFRSKDGNSLQPVRGPPPFSIL